MHNDSIYNNTRDKDSLQNSLVHCNAQIPQISRTSDALKESIKEVKRIESRHQRSSNKNLNSLLHAEKAVSGMTKMQKRM